MITLQLVSVLHNLLKAPNSEVCCVGRRSVNTITFWIHILDIQVMLVEWRYRLIVSSVKLWGVDLNITIIGLSVWFGILASFDVNHMGWRFCLSWQFFLLSPTIICWHRMPLFVPCSWITKFLKCWGWFVSIGVSHVSRKFNIFNGFAFVPGLH